MFSTNIVLEEFVLRSLKAWPLIKPVLESFCWSEVRAHVNNELFLKKFRPCIHVSRKVSWMFEIISTCSFSFGPWTVESASFLVCFTSVLFHDLVSGKFDCGNVFWKH